MLSAQVQNSTNIKAQYLLGDLSNTCIATKMNWLARRRTRRIEDMAYCMFRIFGITTSICYGKGEGALLRLGQELIGQKTLDETLFAWRISGITSCGLLAPRPTYYLESGNLTIDLRRYAPQKGLKVTDGDINSEAPNKLPENGNAADWMAITACLRMNYMSKLDCLEAGLGPRNTVIIHLPKDKKGNWRRINCDKWRQRWKLRSSRSIFGPKTRLIKMFQAIQGEKD